MSDVTNTTQGRRVPAACRSGLGLLEVVSLAGIHAPNPGKLLHITRGQESSLSTRSSLQSGNSFLYIRVFNNKSGSIASTPELCCTVYPAGLNTLSSSMSRSYMQGVHYHKPSCAFLAVFKQSVDEILFAVFILSLIVPDSLSIPTVRTLALHLSQGAPTEGSKALNPELSRRPPEDLFEDYSIKDMTFNPPCPANHQPGGNRSILVLDIFWTKTFRNSSTRRLQRGRSLWKGRSL
ncbi:hypothetical protein WMY93_034077 [Mugilogobius chulae]|uniref:Uncharacterized protein n=1 Tax=Mugilogobius chulae TaxID=88201 RepID=A0AAW0MGE4_9GOBI